MFSNHICPFIQFRISEKKKYRRIIKDQKKNKIILFKTDNVALLERHIIYLETAPCIAHHSLLPKCSSCGKEKAQQTPQRDILYLSKCSRTKDVESTLEITILIRIIQNNLYDSYR